MAKYNEFCGKTEALINTLGGEKNALALISGQAKAEVSFVSRELFDIATIFSEQLKAHHAIILEGPGGWVRDILLPFSVARGSETDAYHKLCESYLLRGVFVQLQKNLFFRTEKEPKTSLVVSLRNTLDLRRFVYDEAPWRNYAYGEALGIREALTFATVYADVFAAECLARKTNLFSLGYGIEGLTDKQGGKQMVSLVGENAGDLGARLYINNVEPELATPWVTVA